MPGNGAVLVGNGLSLAYEPRLNVRDICVEIVERIRRDSDDEHADAITHALQEAAKAAGNGDPMLDFEVLVGAFVVEGSFLERLSQLSSLVEPTNNDLKDAFERVLRFSETMRQRGISHVIQVIAERTRPTFQGLVASPVDEFVEAVLKSYDGTITVANLNYDNLLLTSLTDSHGREFCDMALGYNSMRVTYKDGLGCEIYPLRLTTNFPLNRRVRLVGLHGSLTWWRNPKDGKIYKFPVSAVRDHEMWTWVRQEADADNVWLPQVVLANQATKSVQVKQAPFCIAYEAFIEALDTSNRWLIVGYSFRDDPVNTALREAFIRKAGRPQVLVVTLGGLPAREVVERELGWATTDGDSSDWLTIQRGGIVDALSSLEWQLWEASTAVLAS